MDVFVLSSREEGIPNALLEAMAAGGVRAVPQAVGGTPEVLRDGETGWLVPPGSPGALADALEQALTRRGEARRRGEAARRAAREELGHRGDGAAARGVLRARRRPPIDGGGSR